MTSRGWRSFWLICRWCCWDGCAATGCCGCRRHRGCPEPTAARPGTAASSPWHGRTPGRDRSTSPARRPLATARRGPAAGTGCIPGSLTAPAGWITPAGCPSSKAPRSACRSITCPVTVIQAGLAVVLGHRRLAGRGYPLVAGVPAPIRHRAHIPAVQAGPGLDPPEDPHPGGSGPVDLADHRRACPAPARPAAGRRSAQALGTPCRCTQAHPCPRPARVPEHPREHHPASQRTETRQTRPRTTTRLPQPQARATPRRGQNRQKRTHS
jgi:hypothetical protein